jgi:hypothetical protein
MRTPLLIVATAVLALVSGAADASGPARVNPWNPYEGSNTFYTEAGLCGDTDFYGRVPSTEQADLKKIVRCICAHGAEGVACFIDRSRDQPPIPRSAKIERPEPSPEARRYFEYWAARRRAAIAWDAAPPPEPR